MSSIFFINGVSGVNKIQVAQTIKELMPEQNFEVISTSDLREIARELNPNTILDFSTSKSAQAKIDPVELLTKQSEMLIPIIEIVAKRYINKGKNVVFTGTNIIPGMYNLNANIKYFTVYSNNILSALEGFQRTKLPNLEELESQQKFLIDHAIANNIELVEYLGSQSSAYDITNKIRQAMNPSLDFRKINPGDVFVSIKGVTGSGKSTITTKFTELLNRFNLTREFSTDTAREALRSFDYDELLALSSQSLTTGDLTSLTNKMSSVLERIVQRNSERGMQVIIEGVNAPSANSKYSLTVLLTSTKECLQNRYKKRGTSSDVHKLSEIDNVMLQQNDLISQAHTNGWHIIPNNDGITPDQVAEQIIKLLEQTIEK